MDSIQAFLKRLEMTKGDPLAQAAITAEFQLMSYPPGEREEIRAAFDMAAILRSFDARLLGTLLDLSELEAEKRYNTLTSLRFVEPYHADDFRTANVHEMTRLGRRIQMFQEQPEYFRTLSSRAAAYFSTDLSPAGRIEWIYHLLCGEPELGATELANLNREWIGRAHHSDESALAFALGELLDGAILSGRAYLWALLVTSIIRAIKGETAQLLEAGERALGLAQELDDKAAEYEAYCLIGDAQQTRGKLDAAFEAFQQFLAIMRKLAELDPSNADWQRELAVAHSKIGDIQKDRGRMEAAMEAFEQDLAISRKLTELDPSNTGWQRDLALAHSKIGYIQKDRGKMEAALEAFEQSLAISQMLAEFDPSNAGWQRDLAVAHSRIGDIQKYRGKMNAALEAFEQYLAIFRKLAEIDPSNVGWQRDLALAHSKIGYIQKARGKMDAAMEAFEQDLAISRMLAELDPSNAGWQRDLALSNLNIARMAAGDGSHDVALSLYKVSYDIFTRLTELSPENVPWQRDKKFVENEYLRYRAEYHSRN